MAQHNNRTLILNLLFETCSKSDKWAGITSDEQQTICRKIERSCYNEAIEKCKLIGIAPKWTDQKFINFYSVETSRILINMDPLSSVGSKQLLTFIIDKKIHPDEIAKLTNYQLTPEVTQLERTEIEVRNNQTLEIKVNKTITCAKCHKNETTYRKYQGRALDEEENISIQCMNCGYRWRR